MNNARWALQRTPAGSVLATSVKCKGKVFHCGAVREIPESEKLYGKASSCIDSKKTVVEVAELPILKKNILQLQLKNNIEQLAIFDLNEAISVSHKTIGKQSHKQSLSIIAIPEELVVAGIRTLTDDYAIELTNCVSMPASIAGLLNQLGDDAFIVLLQTHDKAYVLGVHEGVALFIQGVPLSYNGELDPEATTHAIDFGRKNLARNHSIKQSPFNLNTIIH